MHFILLKYSQVIEMNSLDWELRRECIKMQKKTNIRNSRFLFSIQCERCNFFLANELNDLLNPNEMQLHNTRTKGVAHTKNTRWYWLNKRLIDFIQRDRVLINRSYRHWSVNPLLNTVCVLQINWNVPSEACIQFTSN